MKEAQGYERSGLEAEEGKFVSLNSAQNFGVASTPAFGVLLCPHPNYLNENGLPGAFRAAVTATGGLRALMRALDQETGSFELEFKGSLTEKLYLC